MTGTLWAEANSARWQQAFDAYPDAIARHPVERLPALDTWYRGDFTRDVQARAPMTITHDEMVRVTEWKMARGVWRAPNLVRVKANSAESVGMAGRTAAAHLDALSKAIGAFTALDGVGPATASAVLAVMAPAAFPFFDEDVAKQVPDLGAVAWTLGYYKRYAAALIARASALGGTWNAMRVERALWSHARDTMTGAPA